MACFNFSQPPNYWRRRTFATLKFIQILIRRMLIRSKWTLCGYKRDEIICLGSSHKMWNLSWSFFTWFYVHFRGFYKDFRNSFGLSHVHVNFYPTPWFIQWTMKSSFNFKSILKLRNFKSVLFSTIKLYELEGFQLIIRN